MNEISEILAKAKAQAILQEFDKAGHPSSISFRILTEFGLVTYRLPADPERVYKVICQDKVLPYKSRNLEQARRIAWRILKDWAEAQVALVQCGMVDIEQVFLPYAQGPDGQTLYEKMRANRFDSLALPAA